MIVGPFLVSGVHGHRLSARIAVESLKLQKGANSFVRFKEDGCYGIGGGEIWQDQFHFS